MSTVLDVTLTVNGERVARRVEARRHLVDFLRLDLGLMGTHTGCEHGICGACTVLLDGRAVRSCLIFAPQVEGSSIITVEGLAQENGDLNGELNALQQSFRRHHALQCGFCTAGILISATQFLRENADPSEQQVRDMLSGHLCRCTGYAGIVEAILATAKARSNENCKASGD
jgi:aerobic-type carbon monoxide dehydrogenase small subunit (CoxS/CutS family)